MPKGFKSIKAWQKADDLAVKVYEGTDKFPRHQLYTLTSQTQRAAIIVPANIAEGSGRSTVADYLRFLHDCQGFSIRVGVLGYYHNSSFHVRISGPSDKIATVCSKCADREPSAVTAVHPFPRTRTSHVPALTIGSIANVMPGRNSGPRPGCP